MLTNMLSWNKFLNSFEVRQKLYINMLYFKISSLETLIYIFIFEKGFFILNGQ